MEKETITIEIKQEVSITLLWIAAGVIAVTAAFFLAPQGEELWPAVNAAGIAALFYIAALMVYVLRKPLALKWQLMLGIIAIVAISCSTFSSMSMQVQSHWQAAQLMRIRGVIGRGMRIGEMAPPLLTTFDAYHRQGAKKVNSLADEFRKTHAGVTTGSNIHQPQWDGDEMTVVVESLEPNRIVLVSQETFVKGRDPSFRNLDGKTGMIQEKYILTEKGVTHVSEN